MNRYALLVLAASGLVFAQDSTSGGWRRVGDRPPASLPAPAPSAAPAQPQGQDPEPVDRSDAFGQPVQQQQAQPPFEAQRDDPPPQQQPIPSDRPSYGLPNELTVRPGTYIVVRLGQPLSSDRNQPGDTFVASLAQPLVVDGIVVANRNQTVYGRVAEAERAHADRPSRLALELTSVTLADGTQLPIRSQLVNRQGGTTPTGDQVGTVATTTGIGAVIGGVAGGGAGLAAGAGVGAVAGIAGVLLTRNHQTIVYPETALTFAIQAPVAIATGRAPQAFRYVGPDDYTQAAPLNGELRRRPAPAPYGYYAPAPYPYPYYASPYPYYGGFSVVIGRGYGYGWGRWGRYGRRW
jgi:hypothetical protein